MTIYIDPTWAAFVLEIIIGACVVIIGATWYASKHGPK